MKEKKLFLSICAVCVLSVLASPRILADNESNPVRNEFLNGTKKELFFGPIVSSLEGTGLLTSKSQEGVVPLNKTSLVGGGNQETLHFSLDLSQTSLNTVKSKDYVKIEDLKPYGNPGEPQLPFKSFIVTLPLNSKVSGVNVSNVAYRPLLNKLNIVAHPIPIARASSMLKEKQSIDAEKQNPDIRKEMGVSRKSDSVCKTCNLESFFPGNLVSYDIGKDNKNLFVFVKFFPMQYISGSGRALLVTNADITVNYQLTDNKQKTE